ncbi:hypothetical protein PHMEG_0006237 [Phytophthora megakarya]|uniref:RNase H type-1 domain-containing protein n=1 Tax=Phytophthora megakarya TaxID=4795 RepID=A0A225WPN6_9STRA|nr:hypothetical protein PHMEG_0006237 [Phytophthora megakarya]
MQHWYRITRCLADQCTVTSWRHHYRRYNRMADGLANIAMDTGKSFLYALPTIPGDRVMASG